MNKEPENNKEQNQDNAQGVDRRSFLKSVGIGSAGFVAFGVPVADFVPSALADDTPNQSGPWKNGAHSFTLNVNGNKHKFDLEPRTTLLNVLRNKLDITGPKEVCDRGACGACTVWIDGKPRNSCMTLAVDAADLPIQTVEALAGKEEMSPLQQAFVKHDGLQCGFCTPGFLMSISACLKENPKAGKDEIKNSCAGNICRCGAYDGIFESALAVVKGEWKEDAFKLSGAELKKYLESKGMPRVEGADKVSGKAKYTYDISKPGLLHVRTLNGPFASGSIKGKPDLESAKRIPGVKFVDILRQNGIEIGQPYAVAVADDPQAAEEALQALNIVVTPNPCLVDIDEAYRKNVKAPAEGTNDFVKAVEASHVWSEYTYVLPTIQHCPLEPHGCVADLQAESLDYYESTQGLNSAHGNIAGKVRLKKNKIHTIANHVGGGFGCKISPWKEAGRGPDLSGTVKAPVKYMENRAALLMDGGGRETLAMTVKMGADKNGKITAEYRYGIGHAGPYWYPIPKRGNKDFGGGLKGIGATPVLRAPGRPEPQFISEMMVDDLACKLDMDPLEFRLKNKSDMKVWFEKGAKAIGWDKRQKKPGTQPGPLQKGIGVGCGGFGAFAGCAFLEVEADKETGLVRVVKAVAVAEGGFMNRRGAISQIQGGTIMGISWALFEQRVMDPASGAMLNTNMETYKIAGPLEMPDIEVILLGDFGSSGGLGEYPVVPIFGALGNAIYNALGVRVTRMPFTPKHVLDALAGRK